MAAAKKAKRALTPEEEALVKRVTEVVDQLIQVNTFEKLGIEKIMGSDYVRPALRGTKFVNTAAATVADTSSVKSSTTSTATKNSKVNANV